MRILASSQTAPLSNAVQAKLAMIAPVLEATLHSLAADRRERLGGLESITLHDLAREMRLGSGDAGICFEYAVHDAIANQSSLIWPLASDVLEQFCHIPDGASSIIFGPEKDGVLPVLETTLNSLTEESRVYVGNRGQPPKLKRYIPKIIRAFRRHEERTRLPRSISGLWKADLFLGGRASDAWVGTTVKVNPAALEGAQGLRIGVYPKSNAKDVPRYDTALNLIRLPVPYDGAFMETYYKAFFLVRAFLHADARVPRPEELPDAEDRFVTRELEARREFPIVDVLPVLRGMGQQDLLSSGLITDLEPSASLSEEAGLKRDPPQNSGDFVSLTPEAQER